MKAAVAPANIESGKDSKYMAYTEYHVVYVEDPEPRWEIQYGKRRIGYQAWDKQVATSTATEMAKENRPSKVIIHDRKTGKAESEVVFEATESKRAKGVKRKLD